MSEPAPFMPVKLICGIIAGQDDVFQIAGERLIKTFGPADLESEAFPFDLTDYYEKQMGRNLRRKFISFQTLAEPEKLSDTKILTNRMEKEIQEELRFTQRAVNLDPGHLSAAALIMATAKDFAHRVPLYNGIYAHLEFLFTKKDIKALDWTYPDFKRKGYIDFFLEVRRIYLGQVRSYENG